MLDPDNAVHLYSLHYVYLRRINHSLGEFAHAWNRHPLGTKHGLSPQQLWVVGLAQFHGVVSALTGVKIKKVVVEYGTSSE